MKEAHREVILTQKARDRETLVLSVAFFLLSLGGLVLHFRIHPPAADLFNWIPTVFGVLNAFLLPFLFLRRTTAPWAYLLTWVSVIVGTIGMAYFSIITWEMPITVTNLIFYSTFPDIVILLAKLPIAHVILRIHWPEGVHGEGGRGCIE